MDRLAAHADLGAERLGAVGLGDEGLQVYLVHGVDSAPAKKKSQ